MAAGGAGAGDGDAPRPSCGSKALGGAPFLADLARATAAAVRVVVEVAAGAALRNLDAVLAALSEPTDGARDARRAHGARTARGAHSGQNAQHGQNDTPPRRELAVPPRRAVDVEAWGADRGAPAPPDRPGGLPALRTLIVEPDPLKCGYLARVCSARGHDVTTGAAPGSPSAGQDGSRHDLVLLGGPIEQALGACRALRDLGGRGPEASATVVAVVDWDGGAEHERAAVVAGADHYVPTPAELDRLHLRLEIIERALHQRSLAQEAQRRQGAIWEELVSGIRAIHAQQQAAGEAIREELARHRDADDAVQRALAALERRVAEQDARLQAVADEVGATLRSLTVPPAPSAYSAYTAVPPARSTYDVAPSDPGTADVAAPGTREIRIPVGGIGLAAAAPVPRSGAAGQTTMSPPRRESAEAELARPGVRFALRGAVRTAIAPLQQRARQRGIGFVCHVAPDVPDAVVGDGGRLAQLLVHLVGGAIRFTDEGEVALCLGLGAQVPPVLVVLGSVADSGPGLPSDELRRLLDVGGGAQGPARVASRVGSGLVAAAHLVHGMGGRIWLESERDHGTTVRFSIRLGVRHGEWRDREGARRHAVALAGVGGALDVLVAGEAGEHRVRLSRCLEGLGHRVVPASSGREAIAAVVDNDLDLAVIDLRMPRMDGFELAAVLRTLEGAGAHRLPILALNPTPLAGDQERCAAVGIEACIASAADDVEILDAVHRLLSQSHAVSESA